MKKTHMCNAQHTLRTVYVSLRNTFAQYAVADFKPNGDIPRPGPSTAKQESKKHLKKSRMALA